MEGHGKALLAGRVALAPSFVCMWKLEGNHVGWNGISPLLEGNKQHLPMPYNKHRCVLLNTTRLRHALSTAGRGSSLRRAGGNLLSQAHGPGPGDQAQSHQGFAWSSGRCSKNHTADPEFVLEGRSRVWINICSSDLFMTFKDSPLSLGPRMVVLGS